MKKYKIGEILTSKKDEVVEKLSGEKITIPKGNQVIIGADGFVHHIKTGAMQPLEKGLELDGYDVEGIAEYLYKALNNRFDIKEMLENTDETKESFIEEIADSLENIGF